MGCNCGKNSATVTAFKVVDAKGAEIGNKTGYPTRAEAVAVQVKNPGARIVPTTKGL